MVEYLTDNALHRQLPLVTTFLFSLHWITEVQPRAVEFNKSFSQGVDELVPTHEISAFLNRQKCKVKLPM